MTKIDPEETFKAWFLAFHKLRIQGFMTEKEKKSIWKKIFKSIDDKGYIVEDIGFYEWRFIKKQEL